MPYDPKSGPEVAKMKSRLEKTYSSVSDTAARQAIHILNSVMESGKDEGRAWASIHSKMEERGLSKKGTLSEAVARLAVKHPKHAEALNAISKEAVGYVPGELREDKLWENGMVDDSPTSHREEGSQVPPSRSSYGEQLDDEGNPLESIERLPKQASFSGWDDDDIIEYFDSNPDVMLRDLARMTGRTVQELKQLLMPGRRATVEDSWAKLAKRVNGP